MTFKYITGVLSPSLAESLHNKYAKILDTDESSYTAWGEGATLNKTLPECWTTSITGPERLSIVMDLYNKKSSPFYKNKFITTNSSIAIQKIVPGSRIPKHVDGCVAALTVFLNKRTFEPKDGGALVWQYGESEVTVRPTFNAGVYLVNEKTEITPWHEVTEVTGDEVRYTMQMFVWESEKNTTRYA